MSTSKLKKVGSLLIAMVIAFATFPTSAFSETLLDDASFAFQKSGDATICVGDVYSNAATSTLNTTKEVTYSLSNSNASVDINGNVVGLAVGSVEVSATIESDEVYSGATVKYTLEIGIGTPTIESVNATQISYGQSLESSTLSATASIGEGDNKKTVAGTISWVDSSIKPTVNDSQVAEYNCTFKPDDETNYNSVNCKATLTVDAAEVSGITVSPYLGTYDKSSHDSVSVSGMLDGDVVTYSTDGVDYSSVMPQVKNTSDSKTIYVKVVRSNNFKEYKTAVSAVVNPADIEGISFSACNVKYDNLNHDAVVISNTEPGDTIEYNYKGSLSNSLSFKEVGNYTFDVTITRNENYNKLVKTTITAVISPASPNLQISTDNTGNYKYSDGLTIQINSSVNENATGNISYEITSGTDVATVDNKGLISVLKSGSFTVQAKIDATDNFITETKSLSINVQKGDYTPSFENATVELTNGQQNTLSNTLNDVKSTGNRVFSIYSDDSNLISSIDGITGQVVFSQNVSFDSDQAKTATIKVVIAADEKYAEQTVTYVISITPLSVDESAYSIDTSVNDKGWINSNEVSISSESGYLISKDGFQNNSNKWAQSITFENLQEGNNNLDFYIKNADSQISAKITKAVSIDTQAPKNMSISYSTPIATKILETLTFGFYNDSSNKLIVTLKARDDTSGLSEFKYSSSKASTEVKTVTPDENGEYKVPISGSYNDTIDFTAIDNAGNSATISSLNNTGKQIQGAVNDNTAPTVDISSTAKNYATENTFSEDFDFEVTVKDDNAGIENLAVSLNGEIITVDSNKKSLSEYCSTNTQINKTAEFLINTSQITQKPTDGVYNLSVQAIDSSLNQSEFSEKAYIDVYAPLIVDFSFDTDGEAYYGNNSYENGQLVESVEDSNQSYSCYFQKDTKITVYADDCNLSGENAHSAGIENIDLIAFNVDGSKANVSVVKDSFVQTTKDGVGHSKITYLLKGPFKGDIFARATDYAGNYPTKASDNGLVISSYNNMSSKYDGYVAPYETIIEDAQKHYSSSSITISPQSSPSSTESYAYDYKYSGLAKQDKILSYDSKNKVPLYNSDAKFNIVVSDRYSGIREISWKIIGQDEQDVKNNQSGVVKVNNLGIVSDSNWKVTGKDSNLVTSLSKTLTVKNNSNDIVILIELTDRSGNKSYDYYVVGVDKSTPSVSVSLSGNAQNSKYFSSSRTVTISVAERNFKSSNFDLKMTKNLNDASVNGKNLKWKATNSAKNATDKTVYSATYVIKSEGDYQLKTTCKDSCNNTAKSIKYYGAATKNFIIDKTNPSISVSMSGESKNEEFYFNENRKVTVKVKDRNFDASNVNITITKDGKIKNYAKNISWSESQSGSKRTNSTVNTATFTLSEEGDYTFDINAVDSSNNSSSNVSYESKDCEKFTIDKTAPVATISGVVLNSANSGKDNSGASVSIPIKVSVADKNIGNVYKNNSTDSADVVEKLQVSTLNELSNINSFKVSKHDRENIIYQSTDLSVDGIYKLQLNIQDSAGNKIQNVVYNNADNSTGTRAISNGNTDFFTFSINRNGSTYSLDKNTKNVVDSHYVKNVANDVVIHETNVNKLQGKDIKQNIIVSKDGKVLSYDDIKNFISVKENGSNDFWYQYTYTISKDLFNISESAEFKISIESKDAAKNVSYSEIDNSVLFVVDKTVPISTITGVTSNQTYNKDQQNVVINVSDDILLSKIIVIINGKELVFQGKELSEKLENGKFVLNEVLSNSSDVQSLFVQCFDAAGNSNVSTELPNGSVAENFLISTEFGPRAQFWLKSNIIWVTLVNVGIIAIAVFGVISIKKRKAK